MTADESTLGELQRSTMIILKHYWLQRYLLSRRQTLVPAIHSFENTVLPPAAVSTTHMAPPMTMLQATTSDRDMRVLVGEPNKELHYRENCLSVTNTGTNRSVEQSYQACNDWKDSFWPKVPTSNPKNYPLKVLSVLDFNPLKDSVKTRTRSAAVKQARCPSRGQWFVKSTSWRTEKAFLVTLSLLDDIAGGPVQHFLRNTEHPELGRWMEALSMLQQIVALRCLNEEAVRTRLWKEFRAVYLMDSAVGPLPMPDDLRNVLLKEQSLEAARRLQDAAISMLEPAIKAYRRADHQCFIDTVTSRISN